MKIVISPYASKLSNGKQNPKNYPYWKELISLIKQHYPQSHTTQVGIRGEEPIVGVDEVKYNLKLNTELKELVLNADCVICVETFMFHFCKWLEKKNVIVIWGQSNPDIFGYKDQINLLKDKKHLRDSQFATFTEQIEYNENCFILPDVIFSKILNRNPTTNTASNL